jgi:hypothetical protein
MNLHRSVTSIPSSEFLRLADSLSINTAKVIMYPASACILAEVILEQFGADPEETLRD